MVFRAAIAQENCLKITWYSSTNNSIVVRIIAHKHILCSNKKSIQVDLASFSYLTRDRILMYCCSSYKYKRSSKKDIYHVNKPKQERTNGQRCYHNDRKYRNRLHWDIDIKQIFPTRVLSYEVPCTEETDLFFCRRQGLFWSYYADFNAGSVRQGVKPRSPTGTHFCRRQGLFWSYYTGCSVGAVSQVRQAAVPSQHFCPRARKRWYIQFNKTWVNREPAWWMEDRGSMINGQVVSLW